LFGEISNVCCLIRGFWNYGIKPDLVKTLSRMQDVIREGRLIVKNKHNGHN
jgi:hypothetical protein